MTDAISPPSAPPGSLELKPPVRGTRWWFELNKWVLLKEAECPDLTTYSEPSDKRPSVAMDDMDEVKEQAMAMATRVRDCEGGCLAFWCPACNCAHVVRVEGPGGWVFNDDYLRPTINPSILVQGKRYTGGPDDDPLDQKFWPEVYCHSFIREGMIDYCENSKHELAGKSVPIPPFP